MRSLTQLQRRVLEGRSPEEFERIYGPRAADRLFGSRYTVKPCRPIPMSLQIAKETQ